MAEEEEGAADWSDLSYDLMEQILDNVVELGAHGVSDYARCAAVCVSWRHAYKIHEPCISRQLPVLMISSSSSSTTTTTTSSINSSNEETSSYGSCSFYRITDGKVYDQIKVRMPRNSHCRGSSMGWLIMVDDDFDKGFPIRLFNPFVSAPNNEILLPSMKHLPVIEHLAAAANDEDLDLDYPDLAAAATDYTYLHKAILSADPLSEPDYIVTVIYGNNNIKRLAFLRSGDEAWTPIRHNLRFEDVNYEFYKHSGFWKPMINAVTNQGSLLQFRVAEFYKDSGSDLPYDGRLVEVHGTPSIHTQKLYFAPWNRLGWLLVQRTIHENDDNDIDEKDVATNRILYSTKEFKVFRFRGESIQKKKRKDIALGEPRYEWKEINNLGGYTLFIGDNTSIYIGGVLDGHPGCKPDCIYYTDDYYIEYVKKNPQKKSVGPHDMRVYKVKDGSFEKHCPTDPYNVPMWPVPVWIEPSLQKTGERYKYLGNFNLHTSTICA